MALVENGTQSLSLSVLHTALLSEELGEKLGDLRGKL